ncbi:phosphoglycerate mutase-like protein [Saccharata proteae CBS 121410]|uniref:Phosphoglycerate mutase-like protein n=1 Tax=Saccharata proteae CBS 121410 TaxID=1314787 RepID=A0A6A5YE92_9PEZI|nr:phosphoglycerate mutase-like protein [Saccharata proteae CBS 121410]
MPPHVVHFVRHAEGFHNLHEDMSIPDPDLTEHGKKQAQHLCDIFPYHDRVDLVCASPIRRTIQTALIGFQPWISQKGHRILCVPRGQESSSDPADTGKSPDELALEFGEIVDLRRCTEDWNSKNGRWASDVESLGQRAKELRQLLKERPEKEVVCVSHGDFLHHVTGNINDEGEQVGGDWKNAEFRSYRFVDDGGDDAMIEELEESVKMRDAEGKGLQTGKKKMPHPKEDRPAL